MKRFDTKHMVTLAVCAAVAMVLSYLESLFPLHFAVPGIKIGLANIAVIFVLYRFGAGEAIVVSLLRIFWLAILFGNVMTLIYSVCGALLSLIGMVLLKKTRRFSEVGISIAGGVLHNAGQIMAAAVLMDTAQIVYYLPVLIISGTVASVAVGIISAVLIKRVRI